MVKDLWEQPVPESDSAKIIFAKLKRLRKGIKNWSKNISDLNAIIRNTNDVIIFIDYLEEYMPLSREETEGRNSLKEHLARVLKF